MRDDDATIQSMVLTAVSYWDEVSKHVPLWMKVKAGDLRAIEFRQEYISSHSVVMRALGAVGGDLMKEHPQEWRERLSALDAVAWVGSITLLIFAEYSLDSSRPRGLST